MKNTLAALLEADTNFGIGAQLLSENVNTFSKLPKLTDEQRRLLGVTVEKVTINSDGKVYMIEFNNNIEQYMKDQQIYSVEEAMQNICEHYDIDSDDVSIVVDEITTSKIDIWELTNTYNVVRK